ncbi:MAG: HEPN domain-containing protein [Bacteroidales bacterium]|nr:HEPN domain-containing protein [Bacteroidales bacterium]
MDDATRHEEWYFQSDYDLETASAMFESGRYVYCIFMCHLSIEKALKGLLVRSRNMFPSKSHSLLFFVEKMDLKLDDAQYEFLYTLNKISVPTRYPEDLRKLVAAYSRERTLSILDQTKKIQVWIKQQ